MSLIGKLFIYRCKLDIVKPSLAVFKAKLKATLHLEFYIARKKRHTRTPLQKVGFLYSNINVDNFSFLFPLYHFINSISIILGHSYFKTCFLATSGLKAVFCYFSNFFIAPHSIMFTLLYVQFIVMLVL